MLAKRIIPCLDVDRGRVVKGTRFVALRDAGDPIALASRYDSDGADALAVLRAGADKVAVNTAAVRTPAVLGEIARRAGTQAVVVAIDARRQADGEYEVVVEGGRTPAGVDAVRWARRAVDAGAGEILLTSIDRDGTRDGFDLELTRRVAAAVNVPVIASGGAGTVSHFVELFARTGAGAALAASIFHDGVVSVPALKAALASAGVEIRPATEAAW